MKTTGQVLKNQRQLAESVRNKLKNMLKSGFAGGGGTVDTVAVVKVSDLEEMLSDMEQLNVLRLANKTW